MKTRLSAFVPALLLFLTPLIFFPVTINFFAPPKQLLVLGITLVLTLATALTHLQEKKHFHPSSLITGSGILWAIVVLVNIFFTPEAKVESIINKGALLLALPVLTYLLASNQEVSKKIKVSLTALIASGTTLAFWGILQVTFLTKMTRLPIWMQSNIFTPAGSTLALISVVVFSLVATLVWAIQEKKTTFKSMLFATAGVQVAALVTYGVLLSRGEMLIQLLPLRAGWSITLDALKQVRQLFLGIGFANFPVLFTQAKPVFLSQGPFWNTVFQTNSNEVFYLLNSTGLMGIIGMSLFIMATLKESLKLKRTPENLALRAVLGVITVSFFLVPAGIITYTLLFVLAGLVAAQSATQKEITLPGSSQFITSAILVSLVGLSSYLIYQAYSAEVLMRRAQVAFANNDAQAVYANHIAAVRKMPQVAEYRISLAQINLTLASSLSQQTAPNQKSASSTATVPKADGSPNPDSSQTTLTQAQRDQISTLIQRAIEQGQVATKLRPSLYSTWQNLSGIYRNLINVADGADKFAIQYLGQTVTLDPSNPLTRVDYGGLFYQLSLLVKDKEAKVNLLNQSVQQFQIAVQLKPDYANGYYNLAHSYEAGGAYRLAYQAMTQTIAQLDPDSAEYAQAQKELLNLEKKLPQTPPPTTQKGTSTNSTNSTNNTYQKEQPAIIKQPSPLPSPLPGGLLNLPEVNTLSTNSAKLQANPQPEPQTQLQPLETSPTTTTSASPQP